MKKSIIAGLALLLAGAVLFTAGYYGSGKNLAAANGSLGPFQVRVGARRGFGGGAERRGDGYVERRAVYDPAAFGEISLKEDNADVLLGVSPDGLIHLYWQESADDPLDAKTDGGLLELTRRSSIRFTFGIWVDTEDLTTELLLPADMACDSLYAGSDNGNVDAAELSLPRSGAVTLESDNGNITASDLQAGALTAKTDNGRVTLKTVSCGAASLRSDNGKITAEDVRCASAEVRSSNGALTLTRLAASDTLAARTDNGAVTLDNVSAGASIELRSSNGGIRGTLAGHGEDYRIESHTDNGSSSLPDNWGRGDIRLTVRTDNGSIDLRFAED